MAGSEEKPFPPSIAQPGSVGDSDYSPLVNVGGIIYDAPVVAAAVEDNYINFPNGNPNYALVHDQVIAIDPVHRTVTLSLINGFSFGKPVLHLYRVERSHRICDRGEYFCSTFAKNRDWGGRHRA
jgi:hypothetical protein